MRRDLPALVLLFAVWAVMAWAAAHPAAWDGHVGMALALNGGQGMAVAASLLTRLGGFEVLAPLTLAAVAWLTWRGRAGQGAAMIAMLLSGRLLIEGQKLLFARPRPEGALLTETSYSFPSAHAGNSMMTFVALALVLSGRREWGICALAAALAIGLTRVQLGVHWPSDVLGGWAFGLFWAIIWRDRLTAGRALRT